MARPRRIDPGAGQESVWDYPRPPRVEPSGRLVTVRFTGREIARSSRALRVLETAGAPTNDEPVSAQPGGFYGGWVTSDIVGPFKGEPGTTHW